MLQRDSLYQRLYLHDVVIEKEASDFSQDDLVSTGSSESENLYVTSILQKVLNVKQQNKTNKLPVGEDTSPRALLANAFEELAKTDTERKYIRKYQERVALARPAGQIRIRRKTTTRYAGEPEKVLLMRRKKEPPVIE